MGQERASILNLDENGNVTLPPQLKVKLRLSKKVFVSLYINSNGERHRMTINRNLDNPNNLRDPRTNRIKEFDFSTGIIPVEQFIYDSLASQVVVWFNEDTKELVFQCVFSD